MKYFLPTATIDRAEGITQKDLLLLGLNPMKGRCGVVFDVDGTLTTHRAGVFDDSVIAILRQLKDAGFMIFIVSNTHGARAQRLRETVAAHGGLVGQVYAPADIHARGKMWYRKPHPAMLLRVMSDHTIPPERLVMVGDQMFKDIWSANRAGVKSILVPRRGHGDDWRVRLFQRPVEYLLRLFMGMPVSVKDFPASLTITGK